MRQQRQSEFDWASKNDERVDVGRSPSLAHKCVLFYAHISALRKTPYDSGTRIRRDAQCLSQDKHYSCAIAGEFISLLAHVSLVTPGVSSNVRNSSLPQSDGHIPRIAGMHSGRLDAERRNVSPAAVHVERKLYRQLLRTSHRRAMGAFRPLFLFVFVSSIFSAAIGTASYETRQRRGRRG